MKFNEHLNSLVKGSRNAELVALMLRGLGEKKTPQEIVNDIHAAQPDMTEAELRHAMETAQSLKTDRVPTVGELKIAKAVIEAERVPTEDKQFVESTIARSGATSSEDIMRLSPIDIMDATPQEQAMAYCATVFPDDRHYVFTATEESKFHKRTFDTLRFPSLIFKSIADGGEIPNYAIANQFTGDPDDWAVAVAGDDFDTYRFTGEGSFACMKTLATRRLALLEFDALPLADQARFWATAIREDIFKGRLRTLVFSGTKSIHALIRVESAEIADYSWDGDNWRPIMSDDPVSRWKFERSKLSRMTEHADNPTYRADRACKDPTRLTRFAGAKRLCADGKRRVQRLLWCAEPSEDDIPTPKNCGQVTFYSEGFGLNGEYYKC